MSLRVFAQDLEAERLRVATAEKELKFAAHCDSLLYSEAKRKTTLQHDQDKLKDFTVHFFTVASSMHFRSFLEREVSHFQPCLV